MPSAFYLYSATVRADESQNISTAKNPGRCTQLMKLFLFAIIIGGLLFSCQNQNSASKESASFVETIDSTKGIYHTDSLDLQNSSFITTNFPDTVRKVLYSNIDTLWRYVDSSFNQINPKHKAFSKDKLSQVLTNSGFTIDSLGTQKFARKRNFNRRCAIEWLTNKSDTITTQVQYWFNGKKYALINQRWNLQD